MFLKQYDFVKACLSYNTRGKRAISSYVSIRAGKIRLGHEQFKTTRHSVNAIS